MINDNKQVWHIVQTIQCNVSFKQDVDIYICIIICDNVAYFKYTTEEGHRSVKKLLSFYWTKVSQLSFIFVFCFIYIFD